MSDPTVVGPGAKKVQGPVALSTSKPSATNTTTAGSTLFDNINARLYGQNVKVSNQNNMSVAGAWMAGLNSARYKELKIAFKLLGKNINSKDEVNKLLLDYPDVTSTTSYEDGYKKLLSHAIDSTGGTGENGGANRPTQTITKYDDNYLKSVGNSIAQDFLGRDLNAAEVAKIMPKLQDIVNKGTITTSEVKGGKNVVTTTPGFSQARAQDVVQTELRLGASKDLQEKQYLNFADFLSKNMAGM